MKILACHDKFLPPFPSIVILTQNTVLKKKLVAVHIEIDVNTCNSRSVLE